MRSVPAGLLCLALAISSAPAGAQSRTTQATLTNLENGWTAALVRRDGAYFRRNLAPGFVYTEDDRVMSRDDVLRDATSGSDTVTAAHNEDMVVHVGGRETAVVTGILVVQGRSQGATFTRRYRFTDTWVKQRSGRWQMIAAQDYLIPPRRPGT